MFQLNLRFFDVEGLVGHINEALVVGEIPLELGNIEYLKPKKPLSYRFEDKHMAENSLIPLYQPPESALARPFNPSGLVGEILLETGEIDDSNYYCGLYETLTLRINEPIPLTNGTVIPSSSIRLSFEHEGIKPPMSRRDHQKYGFSFIGLKIRSDLTKEVPSEWFYKSKPQ